MLKRKIKNLIHKYEFLEKLSFFIYSIIWLVRGEIMLWNVKRLAKNKKDRPFKIIIPAIRSIPTTNLVWFDTVFGHAFRKLGAEVKMLYCDGLLDSCDADNVFRNQNSLCFNCKLFGPSVRKVLGLDCVFYKDYISELDIKNIKEEVANLRNDQLLNHRYCDVNVGVHAHTSAIRYFLFGKLDLNNPNQVKILRDKLILAMITAKVAKEITDKEHPDCFFMLHGVYSTWASFYSYPRSQGIETIIYNNMPPRFGYFLFNRNSQGNELVSSKTWDKVKNAPLTKKKREIIDDYLDKRNKGKTGDQKMYQDNYNQKSKKLVLESLFNNKYKRRFVLYPNLAWDAAIEGKISEFFDDVFDWVDTNIEFFKNKRDCQLVIKPHPAELVWEGCSKSITDYIKEKHGPLPENIVLLKPDVPLNAYDLINDNSIALIYNGTLGLELAALGVPVLNVAHIHYREAGAVKKVETLNQYLELLNNPEEVISFSRNNSDLAKKYAYYYFFRSYIRIPFYSKDKWAKIEWSVIKDAKKLFSEDSNLIKICNEILNKEDVLSKYEDREN